MTCCSNFSSAKLVREYVRICFPSENKRSDEELCVEFNENLLDLFVFWDEKDCQAFVAFKEVAVKQLLIIAEVHIEVELRIIIKHREMSKIAHGGLRLRERIISSCRWELIHCLQNFIDDQLDIDVLDILHDIFFLERWMDHRSHKVLDASVIREAQCHAVKQCLSQWFAVDKAVEAFERFEYFVNQGTMETSIHAILILHHNAR